MGGLAAAGVAIGWLAGWVLLWRWRALPPTEPGTVALGATSVIVPARNEEASLPRLLASLARQEGSPAEVLVVDDGSTDATAAVAAAAGARVLPAGEPPPGWLGKPWACAQGVLAAGGEHLVLLDADTWLAPDGLTRIRAAQEAEAPGGLLSVQPYHVAPRAYEQLSALANVVPLLASGVARPRVRARRAERADDAVAFGPCLATSRAALDAVGGFAAVRSSVVEDVALARAYRAADRPVRCLAGGRTVQFRMYPDGWRSLVEGWTKNLAHGATAAPWPATLGAVAWVMAVAAVASAGLGEVARTATGGGWPAPTAVGAWAAVSGQLWWMLRRVGSFRWWTWWAFPVPLVAFVVLFVRSAVVRLLRRPVVWRDRAVRAGRGAA